MSFDFNGWVAGAGGFLKTQIPLLASVQYAHILDKDTMVTLLRSEVSLGPQLMRIEVQDWSATNTDSMGMADIRRVVVFGIQQHPTLPDTNIREGDTFILGNKEYTVTSVNRQLHGQIQAQAEAVS